MAKDRWTFFGIENSLLDLWSLIHAGFYGFVSSSIQAAWHPALWVHIVWVLSLTLAWEIFEGFAEKKWPTMWKRKEHWSNRWIGDPISNSLGAAFGILAAIL